MSRMDYGVWNSLERNAGTTKMVNPKIVFHLLGDSLLSNLLLKAATWASLLLFFLLAV